MLVNVCVCVWGGLVMSMGWIRRDVQVATRLKFRIERGLRAVGVQGTGMREDVNLWGCSSVD